MYAELADFFYVWLKRTVGYVYPDLFKAPQFPYDEALWLTRVVGLDLAREVIKVLAEKKSSDLVLWDSATRTAKGIRLQPILSKLPNAITNLILGRREDRERNRQNLLSEIEETVAQAQRLSPLHCWQLHLSDLAER